MYCLEEAEALRAAILRGESASTVKQLVDALLACVETAGEQDEDFRRVLNMYILRYFYDKFIDLRPLLLEVVRERIESVRARLPTLTIDVTPSRVVDTFSFKVSDIIAALMRYVERYPEVELARELRIGKLSKSEIEEELRKLVASIIAEHLVASKQLLESRLIARARVLSPELTQLLIPAVTGAPVPDLANLLQYITSRRARRRRARTAR